MFISRWKGRSEFLRNVITLTTGTTIAQAIPVAISPILTRMYGPDDFGLLALFVAITTIFGSISNARYGLAIMLPDSDSDALNIAALGLVIVCFLSVLLLLVVVVFNRPICLALENEAIGPWLYFVPVVVFFIGLFNILTYYNNRIKNYRDIAKASVLRSVTGAATQIAFGLLKAGAIGLLAGQVVSSMCANGRLFRNTVRNITWRNVISRKRMVELAYRYRDFPRYSMPAILAYNLSQYLTNILISLFFSVSTLGFYSLVQRVLGMPSALVGMSVSHVFFQQATAERARTGVATATFNSTVKRLIPISILSFGGLYFIVEHLFAFVFGEPWRIAGSYAKVLIPFFAVRFVVAAVSTVNSAFEKEKVSFAWQLIMMSAMIVTVIVSHVIDAEFMSFIKALSAVGTVCYLLYFYILFLTSRGRL